MLKFQANKFKLINLKGSKVKRPYLPEYKKSKSGKLKVSLYNDVPVARQRVTPSEQSSSLKSKLNALDDGLRD